MKKLERNFFRPTSILSIEEKYSHKEQHLGGGLYEYILKCDNPECGEVIYSVVYDSEREVVGEEGDLENHIYINGKDYHMECLPK